MEKVIETRAEVNVKEESVGGSIALIKTHSPPQTLSLSQAANSSVGPGHALCSSPATGTLLKSLSIIATSTQRNKE